MIDRRCGDRLLQDDWSLLCGRLALDDDYGWIWLSVGLLNIALLCITLLHGLRVSLLCRGRVVGALGLCGAGVCAFDRRGLLLFGLVVGVVVA